MFNFHIKESHNVPCQVDLCDHAVVEIHMKLDGGKKSKLGLENVVPIVTQTLRT